MKSDSLEIHSPAFRNGEKIPEDYVALGENVSPPLEWSRVPAGTRELVLICEDPDAVRNPPFVHWLVYNIRPAVRRLDEGIAEKIDQSADDLYLGQNSVGHTSYTGPKPPPRSGPHHYKFKLFALDKRLSLPKGLTKEEVFAAMKDHVLAEAETTGIYETH